MTQPSPTRFLASTRDLLPTAGFGLPPELLARSRNRLKHFALLMAGLGLVGFANTLAMPLWTTTPTDTTPIVTLQVATVLLAATLYLAARSKLSHTTVLSCGLFYEVLLCLIINIAVPLHLFESFGRMPHLTFASVIIVLYPLLVASPPRLTLITALGAAATAPIGVWVVAQLVTPEVPTEAYIGSCIFPVICAVLAFFNSRIVHGMSIEVARAQRLGSYMLEERLGAGGMGEVWKARHRMLARPAAVKLIKPETLARDDEAQNALRRFENEAQATAQQQSPHTVDVYDFGQADDGRFYYVMELLHGMTLQELVEKHGPQPAERVVHILRQVCHSLDEAHASGLVHRDIKPANLFVCRYGRDVDFVKVLDFGLVKQSVAEAPGDGLTRDGMTVGTPTFMAPEMATATPDSRADIYAVGCVAYWLLTGQFVFDADTPMHAVIKHARDKPVPPSERTELEIPTALDAIVLRALEKSPEDRPATAGELSELLAGVELSRAWDYERMHKWWSTHAPKS